MFHFVKIILKGHKSDKVNIAGQVVDEPWIRTPLLKERRLLLTIEIVCVLLNPSSHLSNLLPYFVSYTLVRFNVGDGKQSSCLTLLELN